MLSKTEVNEIEEMMKLFPYPEAVCIDALKIVQEHRGWVPDEAVSDIADKLNMPVSDVEGVATFYSRIYRKPVGRNVILVCDGMSCLVMGYQSLYKHLSEKLGIGWGETTTDNRFTLLPISCLGDCDHAPAMMINNDHYNDLSKDRIDEILKAHL
jgi:NADH-quinone oxidoreductase subunit E